MASLIITSWFIAAFVSTAYQLFGGFGAYLSLGVGVGQSIIFFNTDLDLCHSKTLSPKEKRVLFRWALALTIGVLSGWHGFIWATYVVMLVEGIVYMSRVLRGEYVN